MIGQTRCTSSKTYLERRRFACRARACYTNFLLDANRKGSKRGEWNREGKGRQEKGKRRDISKSRQREVQTIDYAPITHIMPGYAEASNSPITNRRPYNVGISLAAAQHITRMVQAT